MSHMSVLDKLQRYLSFGHCKSPVFRAKEGVGRVGLSGIILGAVMACGFTSFAFCVVLRRFFGVQSSACDITLSFIYLNFYPQPYTKVLNKEYAAATIFSWLEFWLEVLFFPRFKYHWWLFVSGACLVAAGQIIRTLAMHTCSDNFSHIIVERQPKDHQLVTHGIYALFRHPSYVGWFYFAIGTQLVLANPISFVAYVVATWKFFADRIPYEEALLVRDYGDRYLSYAHSTIIGIPLIRSRIDKCGTQ